MTKNPKIKGPLCEATASSGVLVCVLAKGHKSTEHSSSSQRGKSAQYATWELNPLTGKIAVKVFSHGKQTNDWDEDGPKDERARAQPCGCSGVEDTHALGAPIVCSVQPHHTCVCMGTAFKIHLNDVNGCENPTTNPQHKRTWFTDADGLVARVEDEEDDRPEWLIKQTAERDAAGRKGDRDPTKVCADPVTDALGKVAKGPFAKVCARELGHDGRHHTAPHGDLEFVTEWEDGRAGSVSYNRKAQRPDEQEDEQEDESDDPLEDEVRSDADRDLARQHREAREAHEAELEHEEPAADRDIKPENMIPPTGETITCGGRVFAVHPMARVFPTPEKQYRDTVESMRRNGQLHDIELLDEPGNAVIDGCTRLRACEELGITPRTKIVHVDDKLAYVRAVNLERRHLDASLKAVAAADLATLEHGTNQHRGPTDLPVLTQAQAAAAMGVSEISVRRAVRVRNQGTAELNAAMRENRIKVDAAHDLVKLSPAKQREYVERLTKGDGEVRSGKVRSMVKQELKRETVERINTGRVAPMPVGPFGLIYGDYPWWYDNSDQHEGSRGHMGYPPMKWDEILAHAHEAGKRAAKDCVLALWSTGAYITKMEPVIGAYGAIQRSVFVWPKPRWGIGTWGRGQTEYLVIASIGDPVHTLNEISTLLPAYAQREHSRKPDEVANLLAKHCSGPFLELFARERREGWTPWGAEADHFEDQKTDPEKPRSKILTLTDRCPKCSREYGEHDGNKCPRNVSPAPKTKNKAPTKKRKRR